MAISAKTAGQIAHAHGLTLDGAAALHRLAGTPEEAEDLAELFGPTPHISRNDLKTMDAATIEAHRVAGHLDAILSGGKE